MALKEGLNGQFKLLLLLLTNLLLTHLCMRRSAGKMQRKLGSGGVFGELAVVENSARTATVISLTTVELLTVRRE
eukprot:9083912-Pyramimonas_sp.AAC.1